MKEGSPSPAQYYRRRSTPSRRVVDMPAHQDTLLVDFRTTAQGSKPCLITHSRANLALTLTKLVLRTNDLIFMLLDGLEVFLGVSGMSSNSSKLQMAGELIYIGLQVELAICSH